MASPVSNDLSTIVEMLTYRRPASSKTERAFIQDFIKPLGVSTDPAGNLIKRVGDAPILWSCHTDTVHKTAGRQQVLFQDGIAYTADAGSNCLGADDTAGVWLMAEMIKANVPGLYIFHRAEEIGGIGSRFIAKERPFILEGIEAAIALDRRGTGSVITHQGVRCCSDTFASSLAYGLGMDHRLDTRGIFTDTANYMDIIPECTNLSVGYAGEHTQDETLDADYLISLRDALVSLDTNQLVIERNPAEPESATWDCWDLADQYPTRRHTASMYQLVRDNPDQVADWLESMGLDATELEEAVLERGGFVRR